MERKIRNNVFETNSSSTHSVSIAYGGKEDLKDIFHFRYLTS